MRVRHTGGSDLRRSFNQVCAEHRDAANARHQTVSERIEELEAELADLRQLGRQLSAVEQAA